MASVVRIMLTAAAMGVVLSSAPAAKPQAEKEGAVLRFELVDGSVITGRIAAKTIAIRLSSGNVLGIPTAAVKELVVGLNDRPGAVRPVAKPGSDKIRQELRRKCIDLGLAGPVIKYLAAHDASAPKSAVRPIEPRSKIRTRVNTFLGKLVDEEFKVASLYGPVTVKLDKVRRICPKQSGSGFKY